MFFQGLKGYNYFFPDSIKENKNIPSVVITSFRIFDNEASLDKSISKTDEIKLSYKENFFSFEFAALDYTNPKRNQYKYKLEGVDKEWRNSKNIRTANYTNIDPGEYVFRVIGSNNDGVWNEEGASVRIIITPPWWATWWFRTIAIFAIAGIFGGSVRYVTIQRYKRRLALEKERTRISKDMHDEVGSSLSKISILSELAKQKADDPKLKSDVEKISQSASEVVDNISEIIWAINPKNDSLDNLLAYIREYAAETLELKSIEYKIELPENIPAYNLSAETRRNIFLVIKEALNNIIKYANATLVNITVKLMESRLEISIKDNGNGFDVNNTRKFGNGLINMRKRIEDIGGEFKLDSEPGKGTEIRFSIKTGK
jgi:two-component sensor histidine kinase